LRIDIWLVSTAQSVKQILIIATIATTVPFAPAYAKTATTAPSVKKAGALFVYHAPFVMIHAVIATSAPFASLTVNTAIIAPFATMTAVGAPTAPVPGISTIRCVLPASTTEVTPQSQITAALWTNLCVHTATALRLLVSGTLATCALLIQLNLLFLFQNLLLSTAQAVNTGAITATTVRFVPLPAEAVRTALVPGSKERGVLDPVWHAVTTCPEIKGMMAALRKNPFVPTPTALWLLETCLLERFAFKAFSFLPAFF
jgi:hypothetical protein